MCKFRIPGTKGLNFAKSYSISLEVLLGHSWVNRWPGTEGRTLSGVPPGQILKDVAKSGKTVYFFLNPGNRFFFTRHFWKSSKLVLIFFSNNLIFNQILNETFWDCLFFSNDQIRAGHLKSFLFIFFNERRALRKKIRHIKFRAGHLRQF